MHTLEIKLRQHTPLIHFQPDQEGATLRASEVKPRLDRFILAKLGNGNRENGLAIASDRGWIIREKALNYRIRIDCQEPFKMPMNVEKAKEHGLDKKNELGEQLYTTTNYPDNQSSLIMTNIGGRRKSDVMNFVVYDDITMYIILKNDDTELSTMIEQCITEFIYRNCFGNRKSKGFGSYEVTKINGKDVNNSGFKKSDSSSISFNLSLDYDDTIIFKDVFRIINGIWKCLKKVSGTNTASDNSVLLNIRPQQTSGHQRIPSAVNIKPLIYIEDDKCTVRINFFFNHDVIKTVNSRNDTNYYKQLIANNAIKIKNTIENTRTDNIIELNSIKINN